MVEFGPDSQMIREESTVNSGKAFTTKSIVLGNRTQGINRVCYNHINCLCLACKCTWKRTRNSIAI